MQQTRIHTDRSNIVWFHRFTDVLIPIFSLVAITQLFSEQWHDRYLIMGILGGLLFIFSAQFVGIYVNWRGRSLFSSFKLILSAWLLTWVSLIAIAFLAKDAQNFSRIIIVEWALLTPALLMGYRLILRLFLGNIRASGKNHSRVAILGAGQIGLNIAETFQSNPWLGYKVVAFFDDNPELQGEKFGKIPVLGSTLEIANAAKNGDIDEVFICLPLRAEQQIKHILTELTDSTVIVKFIPDLFNFDLMHAKWVDVNGIPVISVFDTPLSSKTSALLKRIEDIILSSIILTLISPIMFVLAIGVKLTSPGPVFYKQTRIGWNGKEFSMLKFRSMPVDVEKSGVQWGSAKNKTNTKFGQFIRATSLDELPQFLNVLKGDMSIVGPRPERDVFVEQFRKEIPRYMQKHMVKAGITGWAQINGWRGDTSLEKRVEFDLHYINNWSIWLDLKIIFLTVFKGFINKNAY
ncbi:undecaprenyl-phosphate glucose phosphotransferase [Thiomicrorhabdus heinhorstiae]|uniref:Undecaprenyl-phosphate glucose phosphotransferase n=1 Tax=Thiomicrorhabdus heinhorstiae TaxID=2748010 RepID=A0ABS0BZA5_9GAMM|nr:undecaprenyl-phosphate glucose phosphotransferase [Thiomicrorhabdus heinhorstiae]MBF6059122.1 undecaprenyl-phosphate glucose phosphotransferase [Thiomicrorhabdus heinhorstiae]